MIVNWMTSIKPDLAQTWDNFKPSELNPSSLIKEKIRHRYHHKMIK